ncbi:plasmid replication protein RepC [Botrimarina hoheduenensis]|uniref:Uncharacterized protein n=1 Tax=Botrimarina hoheduenensis TaxID=2528000 RepID=A0A5C5WFR5_9BACT|nr:plasmid replication protein RepC [Botrimarina hoheduenensis]TWT48935.1 hypothetical protein Pla111_07130 [Botrimarina hoheduenensis]
MQTTANTTNQGSGGLASVLTEPLTERDLDFSRLDRTVDRYQLLLLAKRVGKQAGFTPRMLQLLEYYLAYTTAKDWEEGSRPIVFQSLARTAMDLGVGERQIQKLEKRLFDIGAICWNDSGNHKRFGRRDPKSGRLIFAYGIDLTPLAYLHDELVAKLHEKQLYAETWRATKREISETRRQIRERLEQLGEEGIDSQTLTNWEERYREIAFELRSHIDLSCLRELAKRHTKLHDTLYQAITPETDVFSPQPTTSSPIALTPRKRSRSHVQKFAHEEHTTPINKLDRETQTESDSKTEQTPLQPRLAYQAIGMRTPREVAAYATEAFRAHLPATKGLLTWSNLVEAANRRRSELRISQQSWAEACASMGRAGAAACVILTDRAMGHQQNPVRRPAAYFSGLARKARRGELELQRSLLLQSLVQGLVLAKRGPSSGATPDAPRTLPLRPRPTPRTSRVAPGKRPA